MELKQTILLFKELEGMNSKTEKLFTGQCIQRNETFLKEQTYQMTSDSFFRKISLYMFILLCKRHLSLDEGHHRF